LLLASADALPIVIDPSSGHRAPKWLFLGLPNDEAALAVASHEQ